MHGKLKQSYGPKITITNRPTSSVDNDDVSRESEFDIPYICQMDDDGALLVADRRNDRMLLLTSTRQWRRFQLSNKLDWPRDAVWWRGRLYVSTLGDDKLTMFE